MPPRPPLKIVHIGPDSPFMQFAAEVFESVAPGANEYVITGIPGQSSPLYPIAARSVYVTSPSALRILTVLARRLTCDLIVAHSMTLYAAAAFARANRATVAMWSGWGYDYYETDIAATRELLGQQTLELIDEITPPTQDARRPLAQRMVSAIWAGFARRLVGRAAFRADYFSAPVPTDEPIFRSRFPRFRGQYSQLNYASLEDTFATVEMLGLRRTGVLIGNSATPTNNHLEAFELLSGHDLGGRKIIVPLSYGDPTYRDAIVERGKHLFGDNFVPLVERMPLDEYNVLIAGCDVVIMNQRRQQALGNIGTALWTGANIFLDEANPVYTFLRQQGATVRPTSDLRSAGTVSRTLSEYEGAANRSFVESFWGSGRVHENVATLLDKVSPA